MKFLDYIQGQRKGKDANEIEKQSLTDPFMSDAIDGYDTIQGDHWIHIVEMQDKVRKVRTPSKAKRTWRVLAAAVVFFAILSSYFYLSDQGNYTNLMSYVTSTPERIDSQFESKAIAADMTQHEEVEVMASSMPVSDSVNEDITYRSNDETINSAVKDAFADSEDTSVAEIKDLSTSKMLVVDDIGNDSALNEVVVARPSSETEIEPLASETKSRVLSQSVTPSVAKSNRDKILRETVSVAKERSSNTVEKKNDTVADKPNSVAKQNSEKSVPVVGEDNYRKYLKNNIRYPKKGKCLNIKGTVVLEFKVTETGRPMNIRVVKSLCVDLDQEAIRLLRKGSDWTISDMSARLTVYFEGKKDDK